MEVQFLPGRRGRTECNGIVGAGTGEGAGSIIIGIAVSSRANILKELRVRAGLARIRIRVRSTTAILRLPKRIACAFTCHALPVFTVHYLQLRRACIVQLHTAASHRTITSGAALWCY